MQAAALASGDLGGNPDPSIQQRIGSIALVVAIFATIAAAPIVAVRLVDAMLGRRAVRSVETVLA